MNQVRSITNKFVPLKSGSAFYKRPKLTGSQYNHRFLLYPLEPCIRPSIQIPDQYIRKQKGIHLSGIQIVGLSVKLAVHYSDGVQIPDHLAVDF